MAVTLGTTDHVELSVRELHRPAAPATSWIAHSELTVLATSAAAAQEAQILLADLEVSIAPRAAVLRHLRTLLAATRDQWTASEHMTHRGHATVAPFPEEALALLRSSHPKARRLRGHAAVIRSADDPIAADELRAVFAAVIQRGSRRELARWSALTSAFELPPPEIMQLPPRDHDRSCGVLDGLDGADLVGGACDIANTLLELGSLDCAPDCVPGCDPGCL